MHRRTYLQTIGSSAFLSLQSLTTPSNPDLDQLFPPAIHGTPRNNFCLDADELSTNITHLITYSDPQSDNTASVIKRNPADTNPIIVKVFGTRYHADSLTDASHHIHALFEHVDYKRITNSKPRKRFTGANWTITTSLISHETTVNGHSIDFDSTSDRNHFIAKQIRSHLNLDST